MNENIFAHFTNTVADYDTVADKVVMKNDELQGVICGALPNGRTDRKYRVLDLGSGTGDGMARVLKRFSTAHVTGVDFSRRMNDRARQVLVEFEGRFELLEKNINDLDYSAWYGQLQAVVSGVTIHNTSHDQKRGLFKNVFKSLEYGGVFVNGDFIAGETPVMDWQYRAIYRKYMESRLLSDELQVWLKHAMEEDMPMKLSDQITILYECGFRDVAVLWQFVNEAVYVAKK